MWIADFLLRSQSQSFLFQNLALFHAKQPVRTLRPLLSPKRQDVQTATLLLTLFLGVDSLCHISFASSIVPHTVFCTR